MKFSINDFFSKWVQIRRKLRIWSHLLKKSLMENFIFCKVIDLSFPEIKNLCHVFLFYVEARLLGLNPSIIFISETISEILFSNGFPNHF